MIYQLNDIEGNPIGLYQSGWDTVDTQNFFDQAFEAADQEDADNLQDFMDEWLEEHEIERIYAQNIDSNLE